MYSRKLTPWLENLASQANNKKVDDTLAWNLRQTARDQEHFAYLLILYLNKKAFQ